jgi:hypothetical protein
MVSHNQQSSNPWFGWMLSLPNLTLDMVSHNQYNSTNRWIDWIGGVLLVVTIHRLNLERLNLEWDFYPNGLNPEWD